jgi:prepilin-type N-terminal cleavage/methylation domain-containing protein
MDRQRGFTLAELVFTLAIVAGLLGWGLPTFRDAHRNAERSREVQVHTPAEAMDLCAASGLVLAMRLHGLILAAVSGAPVAALSYDPKVQAAAQALGCPVHQLDQPPSSAALVSAWQPWVDHPQPAERLAQLRLAGQVHRQVFSRLQP